MATFIHITYLQNFTDDTVDMLYHTLVQNIFTIITLTIYNAQVYCNKDKRYKLKYRKADDGNQLKF